MRQDPSKYFSFSSRKAIIKASEHAQILQVRYLDPEHIFYAILKQENSSAVKLLKTIDTNIPQLLFQIESYLNQNIGDFKGEPDFSIRTVDMLEMAHKEMQLFEHTEIGTIHILIAIVQDKHYIVKELVQAHNISAETLRQAFYRYLRNPKSSAAHAQQSKREQQQQKQPSNLAKYSRDLTSLAEQNKLDPVIGRTKEIDRLLQILAKRHKNNPILVGEPGVGKTAIVEGLAQLITKRQVPSTLQDKRVISLNLTSIIAGTRYRGDFEERMKVIIQEILSNQNKFIIFIDELHTILGAGSGEGSLDAGNILKPYLARGELRCVGATTFKEYRKYIEKDGALSRRFQPIFVEEPSAAEATLILEGVRSEYEKFHKVKITDEAIKQAIMLSQRYITDRNLPDKAIDVIDEAAAYLNLEQIKVQDSAKHQKEVEIEAIFNSDDESEIEKSIEEKLLVIDTNVEEVEEEHIVTKQEISKVVELWTGIPISNKSETDLQDMRDLDERIAKNIVGQDDAITVVSRSLKRAFAGIRDTKRPIGSFILLGPTGVGKTEMAKVLAKELFKQDECFVRIDMSEYTERHTVSRLVGSPPGYVGYDEGGQLTEAVRQHPYSLILFDEMEKAHPDVFHVLLQLLDDAILTDGQGRKVFFHNCVIIFTTNIAGKFFDEGEVIGFKQVKSTTDEIVQQTFASYKKRGDKELKRIFRPEFLNRIDEIIYFNPLNRIEVTKITQLMLEQLADRLAETQFKIEWNNDLVAMIVEDGYNPAYGARNIRRSITRKVEDPLSEKIISGELVAGDFVKIGATNGLATFDIQKQVDIITQ